MSGFWNVSVVGVLAGKRDGVVDRWGNDGGVSCWWSSLVRNKRKTLTKISALFESHPLAFRASNNLA